MKINKVSVENMKGKSGREMPNQFIIRTEDGVYFQSYASVIAFKPFAPASDSVPVTLDVNKWDYSRTTARYRNEFLRETTKEIQAKIKSGVYKLEDLNA